MTREPYTRLRHEDKYLLSPEQEPILRTVFGAVLMPDPYARKNGGSYAVHSLYFDDLCDTCLQENLRGADPRSKFRIRYYNRNLDYIVLEKKTKSRGLGLKTECTLTREECGMLMQGDIPDISVEMSAVKQALLTEMRIRRLIPRVIVDYQRTPFVYPGGNVRVTFDRALTASDEMKRFLDGHYHRRPAIPGGQTILEVKWDELLPSHIREIVQPENLTLTAFSKYTRCRSAIP